MKVVVVFTPEGSPLTPILWEPEAPAVAPEGMSPEQVKLPSEAAVAVQMTSVVGFGALRPVLYLTLIESPGSKPLPETSTAVPGAPEFGVTLILAGVVIRPMELYRLVNHSAPSGPAAIPSG